MVKDGEVGMILYIAGKITGDSKYKEKFDAAETYLGTWKGHTVLNPAMLPEGLKSYEDYMDICKKLLELADGIVLLEGWKESAGASRELNWAREWGKKVYEGIESVPFTD